MPTLTLNRPTASLPGMEEATNLNDVVNIRNRVSPWRQPIRPSLKYKVEYKDKQSIQELLGDVGQTVLDKVLRLANSVRVQESWPLTKVQLQRYRDEEVSGWEYILAIMFFDCPFETADSYLHEFYKHVDNLTSQLNEEEKAIMRKLLHFDIESTA